MRLSVTWLDEYKAFLADDEYTSAMLEERLFGAFKPNPAMAAGTSLHTILENLDEPENLRPSLLAGHNGHYFDLDPDDLDGELVLGARHEREHHIVFDLGDNICLSGRLDVMTPDAVYDHKLSSCFSPERYLDSMQWRAYLLMSGRKKFVYQVFVHAGLSSKSIPIKEYHALPLYGYDGMRDDVVEVARGLADFCKNSKRCPNKVLMR